MLNLNPCEHFKYMLYNPEDVKVSDYLKTIMPAPTGQTLWGMKIFTSKSVPVGSVQFRNSLPEKDAHPTPKEGR